MIHTTNTITHKWWIPRTISIKEKESYQQIVEGAVLYLKSSTEEFIDNSVNPGITTNLTITSSINFEFSTDNLTEFTEWDNLTENQVLGWCGVSTSSITGSAKDLMDKHEKQLLKDKNILEDPRDYTIPTWWT